MEGSGCYLICDTILGLAEGTEKNLHQSSQSSGQELNTQTSHIDDGSATHLTRTLMSHREVLLIG